MRFLQRIFRCFFILSLIIFDDLKIIQEKWNVTFFFNSGADVDWIMYGSGSVSHGTGRTLRNDPLNNEDEITVLESFVTEPSPKQQTRDSYSNSKKDSERVSSWKLLPQSEKVIATMSFIFGDGLSLNF